MVLGIALLAIVYAGHTFPNENVSLNNGEVTSFSSGWYYIKGEAQVPVDMTNPLPTELQKELLIRNRLPDVLPDDTVLCIETYHQYLKAYIDGEVVYEYGADGQSYFDKNFGDVWNFIPIPNDAVGKEISVELSPTYPSFNQKIYPAFLGNRNATVFYLLKNNIGIILFCVLTTFWGIIFLLFSLLVRFKRFDLNLNGFTYLAIFILMSSLWIFADSKVIQFFLKNKVEPYLLSFFTFLLLPIPFLLFLKGIAKHGKAALNLS